MTVEQRDIVDAAKKTALSIAEEAADIRDQLSQAGGPETIFQKAQKAAATGMSDIVAKWSKKAEKLSAESSVDLQEAPEGTPEMQELIDQAPDLHEYEALLLKHMGGLSAISADVLPSLVRLLPALKSGNLEAIGDSPDLPVLLEALREGIIKDEALRTDMLNILSDWVQNFTVKTIKKHTGEAIPQEMLDTLSQDIDLLLTNPENQITLLNVILDEDVLPKIISGEDLDIKTEVEILGALGRKGHELLNLNHLKATLGHFWDGMTSEIATNLLGEGLSSLGQEEVESEKDPTANIPDFLANQENADKVAQFFEENQEQLIQAGADLPVLYLAVRAMFNGDFENPAIGALANNESLGGMMSQLREFIGGEEEIREGILEESEKGVISLLKAVAPEREGRDWEAIAGEIEGIMSANPQLQADYLDFVFLQFERGAIVEAMEGNFDPLKVAGEVLDIPFVRSLTNQLGDKEKTPNLRRVLTEIGIDTGLGMARARMEGTENWQELEAELALLADNPQLQDAVFGLLKQENAAELLRSVQRIMAGEPFQGASTLLQNENVQVILGELREFVQKTDETEKLFVSTTIDNLGRALNKAYPQVERGALTEALQQVVTEDDVMRENILQLALNPDKMSQVLNILSNVTPENLGETIVALRDIPELNIVLDKLTDVLGQDEGPGVALKENVTRIALAYIGQNIPLFQTPHGKELFQEFKPQIEGFLRDSDVIEKVVAFSTHPEGADVLSLIMSNKDNPEKALATVTSTTELRNITGEVLSFVRTNTEIQNACLDYACHMDARLKPVQAFFQRNPEALQSLMDFACDLGNLAELSKVLTPFVAGEKASPSEMLASVSKLAAHPGLATFIDEFTQDLGKNRKEWRNTIASGVEQVMKSLKKVVRGKLLDTFGEACLSKIDKALDSVGNILAHNERIQKRLIAFASNPDNLSQLAQIMGEVEKEDLNPAKVIDLIGGNQELVEVIDTVKTVLLANPEVRSAITDTVVTYMGNLEIATVVDYLDPFPEEKMEAVIDALMANKDLKSVLDSTFGEIAGKEWEKSRSEIFEKGTETALNIAKAIMEGRGMKFDDAKWGTVANRLSGLIGANNEIQQSILHLLTDLETAQAFMSFGKGGDFSILRHPDIKNIVGEVGGFFAQDAEAWDLLKNTAFDAAFDQALLENPFGLPLSGGDREELRKAIVEDLTPEAFDIDKFITFFENNAEMEDSSMIGKAYRGNKILRSLGLSVRKILRGYF